MVGRKSAAVAAVALTFVGCVAEQMPCAGGAAEAELACLPDEVDGEDDA